MLLCYLGRPILGRSVPTGTPAPRLRESNFWRVENNWLSSLSKTWPLIAFNAWQRDKFWGETTNNVFRSNLFHFLVVGSIGNFCPLPIKPIPLDSQLIMLKSSIICSLLWLINVITPSTTATSPSTTFSAINPSTLLLKTLFKFSKSSRMTSLSYRLNTCELPPLSKTISGKKGATLTSIEVKHDNYRSEVAGPLWQHPSSSIVAKALSYTNQRIVTLREPKCMATWGIVVIVHFF